jgi:hypothetical protein
MKGNSIMSVKVMGRVWDLELPHNQLIVLLAMADHADHADHAGYNVYPSLGLVAWKTGYCKRSVMRTIKKLVASKLLIVVQSVQGHVKEYRIDISAGTMKRYYKSKNARDDILHERQSPKFVHPAYEDWHSRTETIAPKGYVGYIYLVRAIMPDTYYKIGLSKNSKSRISTMGVKLPFPIEVTHTFPTDDMRQSEKTLHDRFAHKRVNGEWFELKQADVDYICSIASVSNNEVYHA